MRKVLCINNKALYCNNRFYIALYNLQSMFLVIIYKVGRICYCGFGFLGLFLGIFLEG